MAKDVYARSFIPFAQMEEFGRDPFVVARGEGVRIYDDQGNSYIDGLSGVFVVGIGHGNKRVIDAMYAQMQELCFHPSMHSSNPAALRYAQDLLEFAGMDGVFFLSGGSEATETAMKMARQYHRQTGSPLKYKILATYGSFHGCTAGATAVSGGWERRSPYEPLTVGVIHLYPPYCYRCPFGQEYPRCGITCAQLVEYTIKNEDPDTVNAIILNPVMISSAGFIVPPADFHQLVRDICDRYNVLLIYDEVITGFGRLGEPFAANYFQVRPDILCCGKGMSGGYAPLAAALFTEEIRTAFAGKSGDRREFHHGHTYTGNPVACAAGHAVLQEIKEKGAIANGRAMGERIRAKLEAFKERFAFIGDVRGIGLLQGMEFVQDRETKKPFGPEVPIVKMIDQAARKRGLIMRCGPDYIALAPPLIITSSEVDEMLDILEDSLVEVGGRL
ncbi:MAG: aspartate aminotransferase family protein [Limnochordia bacterium]|nr:aspartate aminotransferase family protein [Bacillota bacterium]